MTEPRTERPDLPLDDRDEPVTAIDVPQDPADDRPIDAPADIPGPEDQTSLDRMIARDIDQLDPEG
ncbi:MAG: hypothetical protein U0869_11820 [Chloroflexota bacterium]